MGGAVERSAKTRRRKDLRTGAGKKRALKRKGDSARSPHPNGWKAGDWVVFDLKVGQIKSMKPYVAFSDGMFETSGRLADRFRPLTLQNKNIVESMEGWYRSLDEIDGARGFNHPDIHQHFCELALAAIDGDPEQPFARAREFVQDARDYKTLIQGVRLFRRA